MSSTLSPSSGEASGGSSSPAAEVESGTARGARPSASLSAQKVSAGGLVAARWRAIPRVLRFGLIAGALVLIYFVALEPLLDSTNRALAGAQSKAAVVANYSKTAAAMKAAAETVALGVKKFGNVEMPGDPERRPLEFNKAVDEVLKKHEVKESTSTSRTVPLTTGPLSSRMGAEFRVDRLQRDLQFVSDPAIAAAVIADLERLPALSTISRLQVRQAEGKEKGSKAVRVTLTAETWLLARKGKR